MADEQEDEEGEKEEEGEEEEGVVGVCSWLVGGSGASSLISA